MIKNNQTKLNRFHVLIDAFVILISYFLAWTVLVIENRFVFPEKVLLSGRYYLIAVIGIIPLYLILYGIFRLYTPKRVQGRRQEFANICKANITAVLLFALVYFLLKKHPIVREVSTRMVFYFFVINVTLETIERNVIRMMLRSIRSKGYNQKHILLLGYSRAAEGFVDRVLQNPEWGYQIRGILDDYKLRGTEYKGVKVIGSVQNLDMILESNTLDEIAITLSLKEYSNLEYIVSACEKSGVHTKFVPDYHNFIPTKPYMEDLQGLPVIHIRNVPLTNLVNATLKRGVDIVGAVVGLTLFSPVMIVCALIVKLTSPGPVFFSQERVGLHNKPFKMYKFRSMQVQAPSSEKSKWTTKQDPRVTPIGKFIRRTSIDETPQFFNVLLGDMSLVGPRPERPFFVEKFKEEVPRYMIKHQVRPGLTGWAQINGYRGDTSISKRIECDLYYIENWTLGLDFKIMLLTVFKGFINKNAY